MSLHDRPHLNAARRRARKLTLARRDGARCTYCHTPFPNLQHATLDHVVPISLLRTWSANHLVLACRPCNTAKGDRLSLLLALLVLRSVNTVDAPTVHPIPVHAPPPSPSGRSADSPSANRHVGSGGSEVDRVDVHRSTDPFTDVFTAVDWRLLARLAHARQSTDSHASAAGGQSTVHPALATHVSGSKTHGGVHRVHGDVHRTVHHSSGATRGAGSRTGTRLCGPAHTLAPMDRKESA
ncbi:HNH endonuclease [Streptomyces sp. BR123]|uniref:HNH endonuclease n=1 Tax=Streptomyces sp. BR123 TaxID=2749828 RepID=UPI0015C4AF51|nr:HNH endonuclease signature motif containing protein [Streptomyces sp. BR123]NXY94531.1 HNH endonuclease [Streptomyces sp. BR123]